MHTLLIWFDHLPYAAVGCCGNTEASTPGFDRFAAGSVTFDNCFVDDLRTCGGERLAGTLATLSQGGARVRVLAAGPTRLTAALEAAGHDPPQTTLASHDDLIGQVAEATGRTGADPGDEILTVVSLPGPVTGTGRLDDERLRRADEVLDALARAETDASRLLLVTAASGSPPEAQSEPLRERRIHVPLLGRVGPASELGVRSRSLVSTSDVLSALPWSGVPGGDSEGQPPVLRGELTGERVCSREALLLWGPHGRLGLRTAQWYLTTELPGAVDNLAHRAAESAALYEKPEDLWDSLDVSAQSPEIVDDLAGRLQREIEKSGAGV